MATCGEKWDVSETQIDHFHKHGLGTRFGPSPARISFNECVSHLSTRFSSALEMPWNNHYYVPRCSDRVSTSPFLFSHSLRRSSELSTYALVTCHLSRRMIELQRPSEQLHPMCGCSLRQVFTFMLVPKSMWTLQFPVLWDRERLATCRKQVNCHWCFLFARMAPCTWPVSRMRIPSRYLDILRESERSFGL